MSELDSDQYQNVTSFEDRQKGLEAFMNKQTGKTHYRKFKPADVPQEGEALTDAPEARTGHSEPSHSSQPSEPSPTPQRDADERLDGLYRYDPDRPCIKCGMVGASTKWVVNEFIDGDIVCRQCSRCQYEWQERPLDYVAVAKPEGIGSPSPDLKEQFRRLAERTVVPEDAPRRIVRHEANNNERGSTQ